ncbi:MAG TPA: tRNA (adenosine(37)-N6)-threonylcarbamoyltransferase complex ATPase subunit type 1 TsaE [bacterium]|nr:tRNA (adenosine(37)-N6)-threonylcarbamoyltransferase complex ATPase subunit type 1 TsaE [bacterium]HPT29555.1 tRNA (adenosine(37)-N6)-threonylcarbamoyltransferase complex ATPase subunit type 1 TsaE [bacterium]
MTKIISRSDKQTESLGKKLGAACQGGEVFALFGDLGAGKTCLTQGIAKSLGLKSKVNSPTFVIMKMYEVKKHKSIKHFYHIDAYRLSSAQELEAIGALDYLNQPDTVSVIEWPERIKKVLPAKAQKIKLKINHRRLSEREIEY